MALAVVQYVRDAERILRDSSQFKWFFMAAAWVFDMRDTRRQVRVVTAFAGFNLALILCGPLLGWI